MKHLPHFTYDAPEDFIKGIWDGVLDGDGSKHHPNAVIFMQTSQQLHWQMRVLGARISSDFANTYTNVPKKTQHAVQYAANYSYGFKRAYKNTISDENYVYKPISEIEKDIYTGWVHNIEVEEDHSYVSDFAMHNCDIELFEQYHDGIIATTGCPSGEVQTWLRIGDYEKAKAAAAKFMEIFGRDNYFVELMNHGLGIEKRVIPDLIRISKELRLPTVASNDLHYINKSDARFHEALLCISTRDRLSNPDRFKFDAEDFYLKTPQEMRALWDTEVPDACDNTLVIAERCNATFVVEDRLMPRFPVPEGYTEHTWFEKEVWEGMKRRFPNGISPEHESRAKYEIGIINQLNFPGYFLVVADFINWAKDHGIGVGPGRGCLSGDSRVLTPTGFKFIKDIQVGDTVFDGEGTPLLFLRYSSIPVKSL
jgi:hypothetical protein